MCACGKPSCPSCKGVNFAFNDDLATNKVTYTLKIEKEQQEQMLAAIQGFPSDVTPEESVPWDKPDANPLADISKALHKYKAHYYPPNGYPKSIKLTPTQLSLLKSFNAHEYKGDLYTSPLHPSKALVFGVPIEVTYPKDDAIYYDTATSVGLYKKMQAVDSMMKAFTGYSKGGEVNQEKFEGFEPIGFISDEISGFQTAVHKFTKALKKAIPAFASWHEVNQHKAYEALGLEEEYGPNPYQANGPQPPVNEDYGDDGDVWDCFDPAAITEACLSITAEHVASGHWPSDLDCESICEECKNNGALLPDKQQKDKKAFAKTINFAQIYGGGPMFFTKQHSPSSLLHEGSVEQQPVVKNIHWGTTEPSNTYSVVAGQVENLKAGDQVVVTVGEDGLLVLPKGMTGFVVRK